MEDVIKRRLSFLSPSDFEYGSYGIPLKKRSPAFDKVDELE